MAGDTWNNLDLSSLCDVACKSVFILIAIHSNSHIRYIDIRVGRIGE